MDDRDRRACWESFAERDQAFHADVRACGENRFEVTQPFIGMLADKHGVPALRLALTVAGDPPSEEDDRLADARMRARPQEPVPIVRDVEMDETGKPIWKLAWKPIGAPDAEPEPAEAA